MTNFFVSPEGIVAVRLFLALILGSLIGIERTIAHKKAGLRTYALVSLASALFVVVGQIVSAGLSSSVANPLIMAAPVISGIGFLGAGLIIFHGSNLQGLTTAAGLWVAAAVGVATGFGLYLISLVAVILTLFALVVLWFLERKIKDLTD